MISHEQSKCTDLIKQTAAGRDGLFLCLSTLLSDFNGSGWVNFVDLAMLASYWIEVDCDLGDFWCNGADFTRNGEVNSDDLAQFITYWLIGVKLVNRNDYRSLAYVNLGKSCSK